jgi:Prolyl 4-Hydroxylase alpha-subunit, N-terminal region
MELQRLPGTEEVKLAALGLLRLQVTFKLDTVQLTEGNLAGPGLALQSFHRYPMNGSKNKTSFRA